jgi:sec-independent protein translocase protein TatB
VFNIGPMELVVLAIVAVIVIGPDKLPALARDAARMLRTLRELATGARTQLRDELGPEFADLGLDELRNLNPRVALQRAILGDEETGLRADLRKLDPREDLRAADPRRAIREMDDEPVSMQKSVPQPPAKSPAQRPLARGEQAPFDEDAT